jgi:hypothetical protein
MCQTVEEVRAHVLALLNRGYSPEEVEGILEGTPGCVLERTALTDPTNVLMQEVSDDGARRG